MLKSGAVDIIRTAYYIHRPQLTKLISAVSDVSQTMGLTRWYKMFFYIYFVTHNNRGMKLEKVALLSIKCKLALRGLAAYLLNGLQWSSSAAVYKADVNNVGGG